MDSSKEFLEVFPNLKLDTELIALLKHAKVKKVASRSDKTAVRVYIVSDRLIMFKNIKKKDILFRPITLLPVQMYIIFKKMVSSLQDCIVHIMSEWAQ